MFFKYDFVFYLNLDPCVNCLSIFLLTCYFNFTGGPQQVSRSLITIISKISTMAFPSLTQEHKG